MRREEREREWGLEWNREVEMRGVRNEESIEGKKSLREEVYIYIGMSVESVDHNTYTFILNYVSLLVNLKFKSYPFKKMKISLFRNYNILNSVIRADF